MRERAAHVVRRTLLGTGILSTALLLVACDRAARAEGPATVLPAAPPASAPAPAPARTPARGAAPRAQAPSTGVVLPAPAPGAWSGWREVPAVPGLEVRVQRDPLREGWFRTQLRNRCDHELHLSYAASEVALRPGEARLRESLPAGQVGPTIPHVLLPVPAEIHLLVEGVRRGQDVGPFERLPAGS